MFFIPLKHKQVSPNYSKHIQEIRVALLRKLTEYAARKAYSI